MTPYTTPLADIATPQWWRLRSGVEVTSTPLRSECGGFARLSYRAALAAADLFAAELPTRGDVLAIDAEGVRLLPVTLPSPSMLAAAGIDARDEAAVNGFRSRHMMGEEWARIHDERVDGQMRALGHDGPTLYSNVGKVWIAGATPGRARLMGWNVGGGKWIQSGLYDARTPERHNDGHCDYSSVCVLVRRAEAA